MQYLRLLWRLLAFAGLTTEVVLRIAWLKKVRQASLDELLACRRKWAFRVLRQAGVRMRVEGVAPASACLLVCNHRSYLDPILVIAQMDAFPVSKSELAHWPVIGWGARMAGVLFLKRENLNKRAEMLGIIATTIREGYSVLLFPEGTTSALPGTLPFRKGSFKMAAKENIAVAPLALHFKNTEDYWVGKESFLRHAIKRFRAKETHIVLKYGPVLAQGEGEEMLDAARNWIEQQLEHYRNSGS